MPWGNAQALSKPLLLIVIASCNLAFLIYRVHHDSPKDGYLAVICANDMKQKLDVDQLARKCMLFV